jgi:hypothetical protein
MCYISNLALFFKHIRNMISSDRNFYEGACGLGRQLNQE